jgi:hypothetical protein
LEQIGTLPALASWSTNTASVTDDGANKWITLPATNNSRFFRLRYMALGRRKRTVPA